MVYDPAWDMPRVNWQQQGSYEVGELAPVSDPDSGVLVCLPPINRDWLPFIQGCLDQLRNPSSWLVSNDDAMFTVLSRVNRLKQMIGERAPCFMYEMRFTAGCVLQFSTDGGTTWADVTGWDINYPVCNPPQPETRLTADGVLQGSVDGGATWTNITGWTDNFCPSVRDCAAFIGLPPNPGDQTPDQLACSIATYLSEQVIVAAMGKAVTAISTDLTLLQFGLDVVNIIPEFILVGLAADAFSAIYVAVQEGTLSDFESALTDAALLEAVKCAIYGCILADGYVKPSNFACILAAIGGIAYAHADVISAVVSYLTALGATGLAQLSQIAGLEAGADCSACGTWCIEYDFTTDPHNWHPTLAGTAAWTLGVGWVGLTAGPYTALDINTAGVGSEFITSVEVIGVSGGPEPFVGGQVVTTTTSIPSYEIGASTGPFDVVVLIGATLANLRIVFYMPGGTDGSITKVIVRGTGPYSADPYGAPCS